MRAYQVYQNSAMLDLATQSWGYGQALTISNTNVVTKSIPLKSFNLTKTCSGGMCLAFFLSDYCYFQKGLRASNFHVGKIYFARSVMSQLFSIVTHSVLNKDVKSFLLSGSMSCSADTT